MGRQMSLTLTGELQAQIFKEKPWVAAAFQELVPSLLQPHAFWEQYVSSELARKARPAPAYPPFFRWKECKGWQLERGWRVCCLSEFRMGAGA